MTTSRQIAQSLRIHEKQVDKTLALLEEDSRIPIVTKYRKALSGGLNDVQIFEIQKKNQYIEKIQKRITYIQDPIDSNNSLTPKQANKINDCTTILNLKDLFLPYKPKRQNRAQTGLAKNLVPLIDMKWWLRRDDIDAQSELYVFEAIITSKQCLDGAIVIFTERFSEDVKWLNMVLNNFEKYGFYTSVKKRYNKRGQDLYRDYYDYHYLWSKCPANRIHASKRGDKECYLNFSIEIQNEYLILQLESVYLRVNGASSDYLKQTTEKIKDNYLKIQIEREYLDLLIERAEEESIKLFGKNLKQLLITLPYSTKIVIDLDSGFRFRCKLVIIYHTGNPLYHDTIYSIAPQIHKLEAEQKLKNLLETYRLEIIAIENGTDNRETQVWLDEILKTSLNIDIIMISEVGEKFFSASDVAREEFTNLEGTKRSYISSTTGLQDHLAKLLIIFYKIIGVREYQHENNQSSLTREHHHIVTITVNKVSVELNSTNKWLFNYVSKIGTTLARSIINHRTQIGPFVDRESLMQVSRLCSKVCEQCTKFIEISKSLNPLNNTQTHTEQYHLVEKISKIIIIKISIIIENKEVKSYQWFYLINDKTRQTTIEEVLREQKKPTRDIEKQAKIIKWNHEIQTRLDLKIGVAKNSRISNKLNFGAILNKGLNNNRLSYISQFCDEYIQDITQIANIGQRITIKY